MIEADFKKIQETVKEYLQGLNNHHINMEARIQEDLGADSLELVEIIMAVEEIWIEEELRIPDDEVDKIFTIGGLVRAIDRQRP